MVDLVLFAQFSYVGIDKGCVLLGDSKPANDVVPNETDHNHSTSSLRATFEPTWYNTQWQQGSYVASGRWVDRTNEIEDPSVECPRGG